MHLRHSTATNRLTLSAAAVAVTALASAASAQTYQRTWTGDAGNGLWATPGNWDTNSLPNPDTNSVLNNGGSILIDSGSQFTRLFDVRGNDSGLLRMTGGSLQLGLFNPGGTGAQDASLRIGFQASTVTHRFEMTGGDVTVITNGTGAGAGLGDFAVGDGGGRGQFDMSGGTIRVFDNYLVGAGANAQGTVNHSAGAITVEDRLVVAGGAGTGTYNLSGGSIVLDGAELVRVPTSGTNFSGNLLVSPDGGNGTFNHTGGTVDLFQNLVIAGGTAGGSGFYGMTGDASLVVGQDLLVGAAGRNATFGVRGGDVDAGIARNLTAGSGATLGFVVTDTGLATTLVGGVALLNDTTVFIDTEVALDLGDTFTLLTANAIDGTFALEATSATRFTLATQTGPQGVSLVATAIPEPGLAALPVVALMALRRRRA